MDFELHDIIKAVLCNKDGTVEYVFDDVKLDEIIAPFENEADTEKDQGKTLFLSSSKSYEISFKTEINEDILYQIGVIHWYDWWDGEQISYKCVFLCLGG